MPKVLYVGMDVDKQKIVVAKLTSSATLSDERVIANTPQAVRKYFAALSKEGDVVAAYEAGCFGFGLYHQLTDLGVATLLAAPGLIPRRPSDHLKTDRRDARTLAFALRAGQLTAVHLPTHQDESVRDYLRMCDDLRRCKQRILHLLLRRGIRYEQGGPWTVKHKNWLAPWIWAARWTVRPSTTTLRGCRSWRAPALSWPARLRPSPKGSATATR